MGRLSTTFWLIFICCMVCYSATIYVDQANVAGPWYGSQSQPFRLITNAVDALALSNAVETGGNVISIADGTYNEMVYLTGDHGGTPAAPNMLLGTGNTLIDGEGTHPYCVHLHLSTNFIVKGFRITGATSHGILLNNNNAGGQTENWRIEFCRIYGNGGSGVGANRHYMTSLVFTNCEFFLNTLSGVHLQSVTTADILNCVFYGNAQYGYHGQYGSSVINIRNSVFVGNGFYGVFENSHDIRMSYSLLDGNARGNFFDVTYGRGCLNTAAEINSLEDCSNNIVANPGYVQLTPFDPYRVYEPSLLIANGEDGSDIGINGVVAATPVSSNTYYVSSSTGFDGRSAPEAMNPVTPWRTIQHAECNMTAGDTAYVFPGTYTENVLITNTSVEGFPVRFLAEPGVVVDADGAYGFDLNYACDVTLSGFEVMDFTRGVSVSNSFSCSIADCDIHADTSGGAICGIYISSLNNGNHEITGCDLHDNGYGLYCVGGGVVVRNSNMRYNVYDGIILGGNARDCRLENSNIYSNRYGIQLSTYGGVVAYNCNIVSNALTGVRFTSTVTSAELWNCNIVGNGDYGVYEHASYYSHLYYCNFYNHNLAHLRNKNSVNYLSVSDINTLADPAGNYSNNVSFLPQFRDVVIGDFRLRPTSPCINAGDTQTPLSTDYYGQDRLVGPAVDIGVYELPDAGTVLQFN